MKRIQSERRQKFYLRKTTLGLVAVATSLLFTSSILGQVNAQETLGASTAKDEVSTSLEKDTAKSETTSSSTTEKAKSEVSSTEEGESNSDKTSKPEENGTLKEEAIAPRAAFRAVVAEPSYQGQVELVGQWYRESRATTNTTQNYNSAVDKIGSPVVNDGLYRSVAKIFLGWSDKAPVGNGQLAEGARLFSVEDKISTAFPEGIPENAKLYAVYFSLNDPEKPFPDDVVAMLGVGTVAHKFQKEINENTVTINENVEGEATLPQTELKKGSSDDQGNSTVIDKYDPTIDDKTKVNEVVLNSEFSMNNTVAMLTYKGPRGGYGYLPILSRDYGERFEKGDFNTEDGAKAGYTHVDLKVTLSEGLTVPEKLYLEFKGYAWRPLYVFGKNKTPLTIFNPKTGEELGNNKNSFDSLISTTSPSVVFGVNTNGERHITVRMILRSGVNDRIDEDNVTPSVPERSIAEEVMTNMTLRALTSTDIKTLNPTLTVEEVNERVVRVTNARAKQSADKNTLNSTPDVLTVKGSVSGHVFASLGEIERTVPYLGKIKVPLSSNVGIKAVESNTLSVGYVTSYKVTHEFQKSSDTPKELTLPNEITGRVPAMQVDKENGTVVEPSAFDASDVQDVANDGVWKFVEWNKTNDTINKADVNFIGYWKFVANKYKVTHKFEKVANVPANLNLPKEVVDLTPANQVDKVNKAVVSPTDFETKEVKDATNDGVWKFIKWDKDSATIDKSDVNFVGTWEFVANPKPEPKPEDPKPEDPKPESPKPESPKPESPKPESPKPESPKPESPKPEDPKPESPKPEDPKPESPKAEKPKEKMAPKPQNKAEKSNQATLPYTGEADLSAVFSGAALSILVGLGIIARPKKERE